MNKLIEYYENMYNQYGHTEKSLGWTKNKQDVRFRQLLRFLKPTNGSILDVGCGFGDLFDYMQRYDNLSKLKYTGIDVVEKFIVEAKKHFSARGGVSGF